MNQPPLLRRALHFLQKKLGLFDQRYRQDCYGKTFVIPSINGRKTYVSEIWMTEVIRQLFALKEGAFVDVGVNLGQTLLKVAACDRLREYLGFEPNPSCADYAFELIRANDLPYAVIPAGLGELTSVLKLNLYREEDTDPSASLVEGFRGNAVGFKPVVVLAWEDIPESLIPSSIAIVKIDVEGGEKEVLAGLAGCLARHRPFVLIEVLPPHSDRTAERRARQASIEEMLQALDYRIFRVLKNGEEAFERFEPVDGFGVHWDLALADYVLAHAEDSPKIAALERR